MHRFLFLLSLLTGIFTFSLSAQKPLYQDKTASIDERVDDLLQRMTIEEKLGQLQFVNHKNIEELDDCDIGTLFAVLRHGEAGEAAENYNEIQRKYMRKSRLGIPLLYMDEALFGYMGYKTTSFPQPIALASSWDTALVKRTISVVAYETRLRGCRHALCPVVNLARDVRWGRLHETFGEDPKLSADMAVAYTQAFEEQDIITCPKHFVANMGLDGKFASPVHFTERLLREMYFPAFKAAIQQGGATSIMSAYNTLDGIPCATNRWLLTDILKEEWGFEGFVVSDGGALPIIYEAHHTGETHKDIAVQSIMAGCDADLSADMYYGKPLQEAVEAGQVDMAVIDEAVRRILYQKFRVGLFDQPYADPKEASKYTDCQEHRDLSLKTARECLVLLKNDDSCLPFSEDVASVAVLGPLGNELYGTFYAGYGREETTVLEGITKILPDADIYFEKGAELRNYAYAPITPSYLFTESKGKRVNGLTAEYFDNKDLSGKPVFKRIDQMIAFDWDTNSPDIKLPVDHFSIRWTGILVPPETGWFHIGLTADDGGRVYLNDSLIVDGCTGGSKRLEDAYIYLKANEEYDLKIEYFDNTHKAFAQLGWTMPQDQENQLNTALSAARKAEVVVIVVGSLSAENEDRAYLDLSFSQELLIREVAKLNKPMAVVLQTGNVITMQSWVNEVPAVMEAWYTGEEAGMAVAEALFGRINPNGKLPVSFLKHVGQVPLNYNHLPYKPRAHYVDLGNDPQFAFGHGLSYTTFKYDNLQLSSVNMSLNGSITVSIDITNTGERTGSEVVQLYIRDMVASVAQPVMALKAYRKVHLKAGEKQTVSFVLKAEDMRIWSINERWEVEPGRFRLMLGSSSADIRQETVFEVVAD